MDKSEPDPAKRGVNIVLRLDVPRDPDGPSPARPPAAKISFANTDISLGLALRGVAEQAGLKMRILPNRVELAPPAPEPLVVRRWDFTPEFAQKFFGVVEGLSTKDFLLASGVTFPSGATASLSADRRRLVIKNTAENLDLMAVLIEATSEPAAQNQAEAEEIPTTADTRRKAAGIVIPEFDLRYATLRDAVDILKKKSIEWDTGEPKRALRGVNIVLQLDGDQPGGNPLTLSLRNVSVLEALRRVAAAGGVRLKVDTEGFAYLPGQADDVLLQTWELKLGEGAQAALSAPNGNTGIARRLDAKEFLQARGVPFPEGARATHLVTSARLIVRNTEANMDRIEAVLEALDPVSPGK